MEQAANIAEKIYRVAALWLGSCSEGQAAAAEAVVSALRRGGELRADALAALYRICTVRAAEQTVQSDFPEDSALIPALRLTPSGRRDLALYLAEFTPEEAAAVRKIEPDEQLRKTEKALRQLTFLLGGAPDEAALRQALSDLPWDAAGMAEVIQSAVHAETGDVQPVQQIVRRQQPAGGAKTVTLPVWVLVLCLCILLLGIAGAALLMHQRERHPAEEPVSHHIEVGTLSELEREYLSLSEIQDKAFAEAGLTHENAVCVNTKLRPDDDPPCYDLTLISGDTEYKYRMDAKTGALLSSQTQPAAETVDTEGWRPAPEMRETAMYQADLEHALFLKEKLSAEGERGLYKYELLDEQGTLHTVQLDAHTGRLVKYSAEDLDAQEQTEVITPEEARRQALSRVSSVTEDQVIFTKEKREGGVYVIAFTLDDGTQYTVEVNAQSGMVNNVDVHPVSADTSQAIGLLAARETALQRAEIAAQDTVRFTKAKIDRNNGAYVYELEFETASYEYEVTLEMETGKLLKYRSFPK